MCADDLQPQVVTGTQGERLRCRRQYLDLSPIYGSMLGAMTLRLVSKRSSTRVPPLTTGSAQGTLPAHRASVAADSAPEPAPAPLPSRPPALTQDVFDVRHRKWLLQAGTQAVLAIVGHD